MDVPFAFYKGERPLNFKKEKNRKKLFKAAQAHSNLMDPVHAIVFFNVGSTTMLTYPQKPFDAWPFVIQQVLMQAIFILHTDIEFNTEHRMIITSRMIRKYVEMYHSTLFWNSFYLSSLSLQEQSKPYVTEMKTQCFLYNPNHFVIPSLRYLVMVYLHRNVGFHELVSLHRTRVHYHARDWAIKRLANNSLPTHLQNELLHMNNSCTQHFTTMVMQRGAQLNKHHLVVKHNSELELILLKANCNIPFKHRIFTRVEAMGLVNEAVRAEKKFDKSKFARILKEGFILLHNYDPPYNEIYYG